MKVCSLYGAGFYYMPGTDMCIKIGGWVRSEVSWGVNGNSTTGSFASDYNNRYTNNFWTRERGYITADAREQTAYGVARGYIAVGVASQNQGNEVPSAQANMNRAFVQWAGFTAGLSVSFFDFYPAAAQLYRAGNLP
ncbi:MAG TPA: porin, partial [Xanthobacteraceae bacterium]|nr:porin [Xanthobacteraceae bacterium]